MEKGVDNLGMVIELEDVDSKAVIEALRAIDSVLDACDAADALSDATQRDYDRQQEDTELEEQQQQDATPFTAIGNFLENFWTRLGRLSTDHRGKGKVAALVLISVLYNAYFIACVLYRNRMSQEPYDWCDGVGLLIVITGIVYVGLFYFQIVKRFWGEAIYRRLLRPIVLFIDKLFLYCWFRSLFYLLILSSVVIFLVLDTKDDRNRLYSFLGLITFIILGWIFSKHPSKVVWKSVIWGTMMQFIFGLLVLRWDVGRRIIDCIGHKVTIFLNYTNTGSGFVYGYLVTDVNNSNIALGSIFAFKILSVTFFFSFTVNILYYYGIMQWVVKKIGWLLQVTVGTTAAESTNAAANIFLGQTEAPLIIKPYLPTMTKSELHAVMTGGFATIAGTVLAAYISFGIDAAHLLSASIMSAPAALAFAKLFYPEAETSKIKITEIRIPKGQEANALDAAAQGASNAVMLVFNIIANLISFLAFVAFLNGIISWLGELLGTPYVTFEFIMGKIFIPIAWLMGVPSEECDTVAGLVAIKTIVNEFAAYAKLSQLIQSGALSKRSETIATYALCGFSNPGSIGASLASLATMAPRRKSDLALVAFRAFIAGNVACFMTACIAGTLINTNVDDMLMTTTEPTIMTTWAPNFTTLI